MEGRRRAITADLSITIAPFVSSLRVDEPLKHHTTFRIGGSARYFADVATVEQLAALVRLSREVPFPLLLLGAGSNVLVGDRGFPGVVVRLTGEFAGIGFDGDTVRAGAAVRLPVLVYRCAEAGLAGAECLAGVPGTVGGALIMNAGTHDGAVADSLLSADLLSPDGRSLTRRREEMTFSYRHSSLEGAIVLGAAFRLKKNRKNDILNRINALMLRRSETQPINAWSAGSVFRNPPGESAGRLIESCGLKGLVFGGAKVSEHHANFIINTGTATASDVRTLIALVHERVKEKHGIDLVLEIRIIGE